MSLFLQTKVELKYRKEELEQVDSLREIVLYLNQFLLQTATWEILTKRRTRSKMEAASTESITSPWDAHHTNRDLSQKREARDTALAKQVAEAVTREMVKAHVHYQAYSKREVQLQCLPALR